MNINPFKMSDNKSIKENSAQPVTTDKAEIDLTKPVVKEAITQARTLLKEGKSKADAARLIYSMLADEDKHLIVAAFVEGATLTGKGALTYWYNCKRKQEKQALKV